MWWGCTQTCVVGNQRPWSSVAVNRPVTQPLCLVVYQCVCMCVCLCHLAYVLSARHVHLAKNVWVLGCFLLAVLLCIFAGIKCTHARWFLTTQVCLHICKALLTPAGENIIGYWLQPDLWPPSYFGARTAWTKFEPHAPGLHENLHRFLHQLPLPLSYLLGKHLGKH